VSPRVPIEVFVAKLFFRCAWHSEFGLVHFLMGFFPRHSVRKSNQLVRRLKRSQQHSWDIDLGRITRRASRQRIYCEFPIFTFQQAHRIHALRPTKSLRAPGSNSFTSKALRPACSAPSVPSKGHIATASRLRALAASYRFNRLSVPFLQLYFLIFERGRYHD
jgi:hypothetical protein